MAANRIGQLYQYTGDGYLTLWESASAFDYVEMGRID